MSRIGRKPVPVPEKVRITTKGRIVVVEGPLGRLEGLIPEGVTIALEDGVALVGGPPPNRANSGYRGLTRALLANMVHGVMEGYAKTLEISGVGYKAEAKGRTLTFSLGYTHAIDLELPEGIEAVVDKQQTRVTIKGIDKQLVGQIAAQIRGFKKPEPYKGKGVSYADETIRRKVGKTGAK